MRGIFWYLIYAVMLALPATADVERVAAAAESAFDEMPSLRLVGQIAGNCGADATVTTAAAYCTTSNLIFVAASTRDAPTTAYMVAHMYGHAVQVRHGVADVALREIRNRRAEEVMLRGLVERQVDCIAGFLLARAGLPIPQLSDHFTQDPLAVPHWGRNPLAAGPFVNVPVADRQMWLDVGARGDIEACSPGEFTSDLLVAALRPDA